MKTLFTLLLGTMMAMGQSSYTIPCRKANDGAVMVGTGPERICRNGEWIVYKEDQPAPLKCGKYEHPMSEDLGFNPLHDSCVPNLHTVTEREWQELMAKLTKLEHSATNDKPKRETKEVHIHHGDDINAQIALCGVDCIADFDPGTYKLKTPLRLPKGASVTAYGARFEACADMPEFVAMHESSILDEASFSDQCDGMQYKVENIASTDGRNEWLMIEKLTWNGKEQGPAILTH